MTRHAARGTDGLRGTSIIDAGFGAGLAGPSRARGPPPEGGGPLRQLQRPADASRCGLSVAAYRDLFRRGLFGRRWHGCPHFQHAVLVGRGDVILLHTVGQGDPPDE